ncbi:MAG TPA: FAD-dependent oxidoreductase, partial [Arthrobacter sp.]|nr:FAD-dependent oxidoreductase [Arthrobacter sp.]
MNTTATGSTPGVGNILIIGNGQAGIQLAGCLRMEGHTGPITVVGEENHFPFQRPPLSKDYLAAGAEPAPLP